jgi:nucleotide-binding universal stress UspA family protein
VQGSRSGNAKSVPCDAIIRVMPPPGITRHRRPFLAPLWVTAVVAAVFVAIGWGIYRSATITIVFLVQPAEQERGTIADPPLSAEGEQSAQRLALMFGDRGGVASVDAVYESNERSAQQTGAALAERLQRAPVVFTATDLRGTLARAVHEHAGGTILIIAGAAAFSPALQELADAGGAAPAAADVVYVISIPTIGRARLVKFRY